MFTHIYLFTRDGLDKVSGQVIRYAKLVRTASNNHNIGKTIALQCFSNYKITEQTMHNNELLFNVKKLESIILFSRAIFMLLIRYSRTYLGHYPHFAFMKLSKFVRCKA